MSPIAYLSRFDGDYDTVCVECAKSEPVHAKLTPLFNLFEYVVKCAQCERPLREVAHAAD